MYKYDDEDDDDYYYHYDYYDYYYILLYITICYYMLLYINYYMLIKYGLTMEHHFHMLQQWFVTMCFVYLLCHPCRCQGAHRRSCPSRRRKLPLGPRHAAFFGGDRRSEDPDIR